jgi:hypothetical protein
MQHTVFNRYAVTLKYSDIFIKRLSRQRGMRIRQ